MDAQAEITYTEEIAKLREQLAAQDNLIKELMEMLDAEKRGKAHMVEESSHQPAGTLLSTPQSTNPTPTSLIDQPMNLPNMPHMLPKDPSSSITNSMAGLNINSNFPQPAAPQPIIQTTVPPFTFSTQPTLLLFPTLTSHIPNVSPPSIDTHYLEKMAAMEERIRAIEGETPFGLVGFTLLTFV